jgi:hypothetical protein
MKFCGPAIFYASIALIPLFLQYRFTNVITTRFIYHLSFTIIWITFLWFLCEYNLNNIGWVLVALPYVFAYFMMKLLIQESITNTEILILLQTPPPDVIIYRP